MSFFELVVVRALFAGMLISLSVVFLVHLVMEARRLQREEWESCGPYFWQAMTASRTVDNRVDYAHKQLILDACSERRARLRTPSEPSGFDPVRPDPAAMGPRRDDGSMARYQELKRRPILVEKRRKILYAEDD